MRSFALPFLIMIFSITAGSAQEVTKEYFDRDNNPVEKQAAYFYKVGKKVPVKREFDTIFVYVDTVKSFYVANEKLRSRVVYNSEGKLNGSYAWFHENGVIRESGQFIQGSSVGVFTNYYPDGKVKMIRRYAEDSESSTTSEPYGYELLSYNDSTGKMLVVNGNGYCICVVSENGNIEKGVVRNGVRDSLWQEIKNDSLILEELYDKGKFIEGTRFDQGEVAKYTTLEIDPKYPAGLEKLYQSISKSIVYPKEARRKRIQGTVFIGFIVERDGTTSSHNVVKGVHHLIDDEALRVVSMMDKWTPGTQRGKKVRVKYVLPVKFKLG